MSASEVYKTSEIATSDKIIRWYDSRFCGSHSELCRQQ